MPRLATPLLLAATLLAAPAAVGQVTVPPGVGTLEAAINANTTPGQVFRLQRGQTYLLLDRMSPTVDVVIEADGGACPIVPSDCPLIRPAPPPGGGASERPLEIAQAGVTVTLRGVAMTNRNTNNVTRDRMIRLRAPNTAVRIERSLLYGEATMVIRFESGPGSVYVYDSVVKDVGDPAANPNEGRFVDDRGQDIGELVVVGSTFYNLVNRVFRHDGGTMGRLHLDHNTYYLVRTRINDEKPVARATITNQLLIQTGFQGADTEGGNPQLRLAAPREGDEHLVRNVNFATSLGPEEPFPAALFNTHAAAASTGFEDTILSEMLTFTSAPGAFFQDVPTPDFTYPASTASFTGSVLGQPLGALNWFGLPVRNEEPGAPIVSFTFEGAAPNPIRHQALLHYTLEAPARDVRLAIYDLMGRRVATLVAGEPQSAGVYGVPFDASGLAAGVYLARLAADGQVLTRRLTVVR